MNTFVSCESSHIATFIEDPNNQVDNMAFTVHINSVLFLVILVHTQWARGKFGIMAVR